MPVRVNSSKEKKPEQVKLVWPGHLEQGRVGRIEEELRKEDIEPYKDDSPRFCRVSTIGCLCFLGIIFKLFKLLIV